MKRIFPVLILVMLFSSPGAISSSTTVAPSPTEITECIHPVVVRRVLRASRPHFVADFGHPVRLRRMLRAYLIGNLMITKIGVEESTGDGIYSVFWRGCTAIVTVEDL